MGIPWPGVNLPILGVVPVLFLMFFVRSTEQQGKERRNTCSKCASSHTPGQNYCTKCGWDLSREFSTETTDTVLASEMHQPQGASTATLERPAETSIPEAASGPGPGQDPTALLLEEDATASEPVPERVYEEAAAVAYQDADSEGALAVSEAGPEAEPETRPWGMPVPGPAPTADGMTARGAALFSEGRLQEAIDQFTKAIALDPRHREALERRAEAYSKQGRQERADEDYRQVQALNAGS